MGVPLQKRQNSGFAESRYHARGTLTITIAMQDDGTDARHMEHVSCNSNNYPSLRILHNGPNDCYLRHDNMSDPAGFTVLI